MSKKSGFKTEFLFTWEMNNYSLSAQKNGDVIISPVFRADNLKKSKWYIFYYPKGALFNTYVSCILCLVGDDDLEKEVEIYLDIEIIDADGQSIVSKTFEACSVYNCSSKVSSELQIVDVSLFEEKVNHLSEDDLTIRFRMVCFEPEEGQSMGCTARTEFLTFDRFHQWPVNITNFPFSRKVLLLTAPEEDVEIYIHLFQLGIKVPGHLRCRISLFDDAQNERLVRRATRFFQTDKKDWKFPTFIKKSLLSTWKKEGLIAETFTLKVKFSVARGLHKTEFDYTKPDAPACADLSLGMNSVNTLQEDFRRMYTNYMQSDVKLRVGHDIFPAHKSVLSARSPVFCTMFSLDMLENQTGFVDILDIDAKTLNSFLGFIYTGTVDDLDYESASKLVMAAEKYQVLSLKESCIPFLISALSDENACEIFSLADMVGHEFLKSSAKRYILEHAAEILSSSEWQQYIQNKVRLATEILCSLTADAIKSPTAK